LTPTRPVGLLFDRDFDAAEHGRLELAGYRFERSGFDLFSFPSQARLPWFDLTRFAQSQARRARRHGWAGVVSHEEPFGALAAALVAQTAGLPGASPEAIVACQNKLRARQVLDTVAPEANLRYAALAADGTEEPPVLLGPYPCFVKPVKSTFSILARPVADGGELAALRRQHGSARRLLGWLTHPYDRAARRVLPQAGSTRRWLAEELVRAPQYNLDGYVRGGALRVLGVVDAVMYPGTQAFARWELPGRLPAPVVARAAEVARRFLAAVGYTHGFFNFEFLFDAASDRLTAIEFNPRLASQFGDLYRRVQGIDPHAMAIALACGHDPERVPCVEPTARVAASLVWRAFDGAQVPPMPRAAGRAALARACPDAQLFLFGGRGAARREFNWLGNHRYGIVHLGARDADELRQRCLRAAEALGWPPAPYDLRQWEQVQNVDLLPTTQRAP
jgi:hypothetical protein